MTIPAGTTKLRVTLLQSETAFPRDLVVGKVGNVLHSYPATDGRVYLLQFDDPSIRSFQKDGQLYFWEDELSLP